MTIWTDASLAPIAATDPYVAPDGTTYPAAWPKGDIPNLKPVADVDRPSTNPTGYTVDGQARGGVTIELSDGREWSVGLVDGVPTQVWHTVARPEMTLAEAKAVKVAALTAACAASIVGGFTHGALGADHTYPAKATDLTNMQARVTQAQLDPGGAYTLWCSDAAGTWAKRSHTAAQVIAVGLAAAVHVQACSDRLSGVDGHGGLLKAVADAETLAEVSAVMW